MELLKAIAVDSAPTLSELIRFALLSLLNSIKHVLLLYPLNVILFIFILVICVHRIISPFKKKQKFRAVYQPLPHRDSSIEEIKSLKKQVREVQTDLIAILKKAKNPSNQPPSEEIKHNQISSHLQQQGSSRINESIVQFMSQVNNRSILLDEVQSQLKSTISEAFNQIAKMNQS